MIEKLAVLYSYNWQNEKVKPNRIVISKPSLTTSKCPLNKALCAQVRLTPEDINKMVFKNGKPQGFMGSIPNGGHIPPIQIDGDNALWKNAQKKEKENIISDTINSFIPNFKPFLTWKVWLFLDSIIISPNHL